MRVRAFCLVAMVLASASAVVGQQEAKAGKATRVCAVCQSWEAKDRNLQHVLKMLDQAAAERADVVCLPEECVPTDGGPAAQAALDAIAKAAAARSMIVAANLKEKQGDKVFSTSYLIGADGKLIGKYRKSHRLPDEPIALGDALPVFDTPRGKIGLMIGSDHYWPEVPAGQGPSFDPNSPFLKAIDEAGSRGSDIVVMAEFIYPVDTPEAQKTLAAVAHRAEKYNTHVYLSGLRDPKFVCKDGVRASRAYLWDRTGKVVGKYSEFGGGTELPVFETDFGVVGMIICADVYFPEICRAMALQGAEILVCGSQSWGASGQYHLWMQQARAIDNGVFMATTYYPASDISQRSNLIDPYGYPLAASPYWRASVVSADIDLDAGRTWFARSDRPGSAGQPGYLAGYYPLTIPEKRSDFRAVLFAGRRPELYRPIVEKTLAARDLSGDTWKKMMELR